MNPNGECAPVFFTDTEREQLFDSQTDAQIEASTHERLTELAPRLSVNRAEYRHFGPYWWWIKPLVARIRTTRGSWLRGGHLDRDFVRQCGLPHPDLRVAAEGLAYYDYETVGEQPASFHVVESAAGVASHYDLCDPDAGHQLDLFEREPSANSRLSALLADPTQFAASNWLRVADRFASEGAWVRGAAALRRAIDTALASDDRLRAWIQLGQLYQEHGHHSKALLCYRNAYERGQEAWIQGLMAELYLLDNRPAAAVESYRAALAAMPGNPEYQARLHQAEEMLQRHNASALSYRLHDPAGLVDRVETAI